MTNVLWHPTSRVLLSSSEDGYLRMYDGKSIEEWDSLQLVQVGMAGTSECGIPTAGDELPETVRLSFLNIVDAHAEGFYVAAAVGPRVAFLDVQPGKRFLAGLPQPAVQLHLRGHAAPAGWQEVRGRVGGLIEEWGLLFVDGLVVEWEGRWGWGQWWRVIAWC